jgi:hypothetical protein
LTSTIPQCCLHSVVIFVLQCTATWHLLYVCRGRSQGESGLLACTPFISIRSVGVVPYLFIRLYTQHLGQSGDESASSVRFNHGISNVYVRLPSPPYRLVLHNLKSYSNSSRDSRALVRRLEAQHFRQTFGRNGTPIGKLCPVS